jgi:hypothetical protein
MISEKIELLGKRLYSNIPPVLTLKNVPTASELDMVGSEDFDRTMIETILPASIEEEVDFNELLEIDYQWICRCLRILNFGPYYTTNAIFCKHCGKTSYGEYQVNLNTIACNPIPDDFVNEIKITRDEFIDFKGDILIKLPSIRSILNAYKDKAFQSPTGQTNRELARICYMISSIKGKSNLTPIDIKMMLQQQLSAADYIILKNKVTELTDFGLRAGGVAQCPACGSEDAAFIALPDDRFFRPTVGNLKQWKLDRSARATKDVSGDTSADV